MGKNRETDGISIKLAPTAPEKLKAIQADYSERYGRPVSVWSAISLGLMDYDMKQAPEATISA